MEVPIWDDMEVASQVHMLPFETSLTSLQVPSHFGRNYTQVTSAQQDSIKLVKTVQLCMYHSVVIIIPAIPLFVHSQIQPVLYLLSCSALALRSSLVPSSPPMFWEMAGPGMAFDACSKVALAPSASLLRGLLGFFCLFGQRVSFCSL